MELDIFQRIGHDVRRLPLLRDTTSTYAGIASMLTNRLKAGETGATADAAWSNAHRAIENIAPRQYMQWQPAGYSEKSQITGIRDRKLRFLYDVAFGSQGQNTIGRLILAYSTSENPGPGTRDSSYHAGYPAREGFQKGHAISHAGGGYEGGANYFPQLPEVNQRRHAWPYGSLWRSIEECLAAEDGRFAFVRPIYRDTQDTDEPSHIEYGLLIPGAQTRVTEFPNTALRNGTPVVDGTP